MHILPCDIQEEKDYTSSEPGRACRTSVGYPPMPYDKLGTIHINLTIDAQYTHRLHVCH